MHNTDTREHLDTFETTAGDCLLLKMLKNIFDRKYACLRGFFDYFCEQAMIEDDFENSIFSSVLYSLKVEFR